MALKEKSEELHKETVTNMKKVLELKPNRSRSILKSHDYLTGVIISDGSTEGSSVVAHFVSKTKTGNYSSHIVRAANKSSGATVPGNELAGTYMGVLLTKQDQRSQKVTHKRDNSVEM